MRLILWLTETTGFREILIGATFGVKFAVKAISAPSEVEADSFRLDMPFHGMAAENPLPMFRDTRTPLSSRHTLSGNPSEFTSIRLYSSPFLEVTTL